MLKTLAFLTLLLVLSGCHPAKTESNEQNEPGSLLQKESNQTLEASDDSAYTAEEDANATPPYPLDYTPSCDDTNLFTFLHDTDRELMMIYTPFNRTKELNSSEDFFLVEVDGNDVVNSSRIDNDDIVYNEAWLLNGYINEKNEMCLYTGFPVDELSWDERSDAHKKWQNNYCRASSGEWYLYETSYYPPESGVWQWSLSPEEMNGFFGFLENELGYPSFEDFNTTLFSYQLDANFTITGTGLFPFFHNGEKQENTLLGINHVSNHPYIRDNNITLSSSSHHSILFSLIYEEGSWHYRELLRTFDTLSSQEKKNDYFALTGILTPEGFSMFVEERDFHTPEALHYVDMSEENVIELVSAEERFGEFFEEMFWKQRLNFHNWIQKYSPKMAIDKLGRYHIHEFINLDEYDSIRNRVFYYNVYDPDSATPSEPVIHHYIGGCLPAE